jgi:uncharacterized protein DUF1501
MKRFPDRPLPNVSIGGFLNPKAVSTAANPISSAASATYLSSTAGLEHTVSDHPDSAWAGLRARHDIDELAFDGTSTGKKLPATIVDEEVLSAVRAMRAKGNAATDALFEELYDTYGGVSRALARDVVKVLEATKGAEHLPDTIPWGKNSGRFGYIIGLADGGGDHDWDEEFDLALRLLKSDLATSVTLRVTGAGVYGFDTHSPPGAPGHVNNLRGVMEVVGRLILELMMTPSPSQPKKSLLDETLVHIFSDFGRTFSKPKSGTDHHPATTMILVGGNVHGNRMIGGYDETATDSPLGVPVEIIDIEEGGKSSAQAVPRAADAAATVYRCFGLEAAKDFFIPGGYGEIAGVLDH